MTARPTPAAVLEAAQSEAQWQRCITDYLDLKHWLWYHANDSRRDNAGFLDLVAIRPPRLLFIEVKSQRGQLRREQIVWLKALGDVPQIESYVFRPSDWDFVREVLS